MSPAALLDLLLPPACGACGLPGPPACAACLAALVPLRPPVCGGCGAPVPVPVPRCPACRGGLVGARQAVAYSGPAPALVAALKDGRRRRIADALAARIAEAVPRPPLGAALVPVPLGPRRARERGFNQSLLIARALGRRWARPVAEPLVRVREGADQRGAGATARARQAARAFAVREGAAVPAHPWLVDDVHTTGATLGDCARALRAAGARRVGAVCFARALSGRARAPPGRETPRPGGLTSGRPKRHAEGGLTVQLQVKGRNMSVTDALFAHAEQKLERLAKVLPPWDEATTVELELSVERNPKIDRPQIAEVTVRTKGPVLRVRESAGDMYQAIDQAARKLERQARRYRDRRKEHHGRPSLDEVPELIAAADGQAGERPGRLVKSKRFEMKPMSPEDAAMHMDLLHHDFYVFRNQDDGQVNVVYRRRDGDYGLIVPEG